MEASAERWLQLAEMVLDGEESKALWSGEMEKSCCGCEETPLVLLRMLITCKQTGTDTAGFTITSMYYTTIITMTIALDIHGPWCWIPTTLAFFLTKMSSVQDIMITFILPNANEDLTLCSRYYPLPLINTFIRIIVKALKNRIESVISYLFHSDQTGFITWRHSSDNACLLAEEKKSHFLNSLIKTNLSISIE